MSKKLIFGLLVLAVSVLCILVMRFHRNNISKQVSEVLGPSIKFRNNSIELERIPLSVNKEFVIEFENVGDSKLAIEKVIPSCSCISIIDYSSIVLPKMKGDIKFMYHGIRQGSANFQIQVFTNVPDYPFVELNGAVFVDSGYASIPKIDLGCLPANANFRRAIPLTTTSLEKIPQIDDIRVSSELIYGEIFYDNEKNAKIIIKGEVGSRLGEYLETVYIFGKNSEMPLLSINVGASVFQEEFIVPQKLLFKYDRKKFKSVSRTVYIGALDDLDGIEIIKNNKSEINADIIHDIMEKRYRAIITWNSNSNCNMSEIIQCKLDFKDGTSKIYEIACSRIEVSDLSLTANGTKQQKD